MATKKNKAKGKKPARPSKQKSSSSLPSGQYLWLAVALLVTAIAFYPSLANDYVNWDDDVNILNNENLEVFDWPHIKAIFSTTVMGGYNPLSIFTLALEKHFFGLTPQVHHTTNLLLHLLCVFLVFRILLAMRLSLPAAFLGALLFGIHPMRVESVAWITERKDVLFGVFYLGALYTYIQSLLQTERKKYFLSLTIILFVLSLLSKIQAVALPLSLLAIDYYFKRPLEWKLLIEKIPYFLLSLVVGSLGVYFLSQAETLVDSTNMSFFQRLLIGAYSFCIYLVKFIFPYEMSPLYPYPASLPWQAYVAPLGVAAVGYWFYVAFKREWRAQVFGLAFFAFNVFFVLQILAAGQGYKADRFTYIPYFGLFFLAAWGFQELLRLRPQYRTYAQVGVGAYLLLFAGMTWQQCGIWKNGETLWTHVIKHYDNTALPFGNIGHYYRENKEYEKALVNYNRAIQLNTREGKTFNSRGKTYFDMGNTEKAMADYDRAIEMNPENAEFYVNRGAAYGRLGKLNEALSDFNQGVKFDPEWPNAYLNRSLAFSQTGQHQKALDDINTFLRYSPNRGDMWYEKAMCQRRLGQVRECVPALDRAVQLEPDRGLFWHERAKVHAQLGNKTQASQDARRAQQLGVQVDAGLLQ